LSEYLDIERLAFRPSYISLQRPRISGTALVGGLHLATGNYGTASAGHLFLSGLAIAGMLGLALTFTFIQLRIVDQLAGTGFSWGMLGLSVPRATATAEYLDFLVQLLPPFNFLLILRLSPLSGYHAAEHKVVAAIERYGRLVYEEVVEMPRAHPRCGTVLLFGVLPALLIAYPLLQTNPLLGMLVALLGWAFRYHIGYFIQQHFTTKPPTPQQLWAGIKAGQKLLALYGQNPDKRVSVAQGLWTRGLPQMLAGLLVGQQLLKLLLDYLPFWLDF